MYEARTWVTLENGGEADAAVGGPAETLFLRPDAADDPQFCA